MEYWKKWNSMSIDKCKLDKNKAEGNPKSIKLIELSSAFFVLGVGFTLGILTFVFEKCYFYTCRRIFSKWVLTVIKKFEYIKKLKH